MEMELVKVFVVYGDGGERGIGPVIGVCLTKEEAVKMAKGKAFYGANGEIFDGMALENQDNGELYLLKDATSFVDKVLQKDTIKHKKQIALAKLTNEDKALLGLKD